MCFNIYRCRLYHQMKIQPTLCHETHLTIHIQQQRSCGFQTVYVNLLIKVIDYSLYLLQIHSITFFLLIAWCLYMFVMLVMLQKGVFPDLLATSGDYLRVWRVLGETETRLECLLNNVCCKLLHYRIITFNASILCHIISLQHQFDLMAIGHSDQEQGVQCCYLQHFYVSELVIT